MEKIIRSSVLLAAAIFILAAAFLSGCRTSDISLIKKSTYGNNEETVGDMFDHYNLFLSKSWTASAEGTGGHLVTFIGGIPADKLVKTASTDMGKWLSVEKKYSAAVLPCVRAAYLLVTFRVTSPATFELGDIRLGISSGAKTVWSPCIQKTEKEQVMFSITRNSPDIIPLLARYADPSRKEGSTLYAQLTGKTIENF